MHSLTIREDQRRLSLAQALAVRSRRGRFWFRESQLKKFHLLDRAGFGAVTRWNDGDRIRRFRRTDGPSLRLFQAVAYALDMVKSNGNT